jgi:hypothetical protein
MQLGGNNAQLLEGEGESGFLNPSKELLIAKFMLREEPGP